MKYDPAKYAYASPGGSTDDVAWHVAQGIQIGPAAFDSGRNAGMIVARRHATGWFVSAYHRPGLTDDQFADLRESVTARVYALLRHGRSVGAWTLSANGGEWYADIVAPVRDLEPSTT